MTCCDKWHVRDDPPNIPGVYQVRYEDHSGVHEYLNGRPCLAYWDGVDTWSFGWFFSEREAYKAKMRAPGLVYEWKHQAP